MRGDLLGYGWAFVAFNVMMATLAIVMLLGDRGGAAPQGDGGGDR